MSITQAVPIPSTLLTLMAAESRRRSILEGGSDCTIRLELTNSFLIKLLAETISYQEQGRWSLVSATIDMIIVFHLN